MKNSKITSYKVCVLGLGYTGMPLVHAFYRNNIDVKGFDINTLRVQELKAGIDKTREISVNELKKLKKIFLTSGIEDLKDRNFFIITVPTPVNNKNQPDLSFVRNASALVGQLLKKKSIVVYESTVFPGCTENICVPILEKISGLKYNSDFFCGFSPERINPGDKSKKIDDVVKVVSGSNNFSSKKIQNLYNKIIRAGTYLAKDIKTAEAAKVIENIQRDLNIGLINELSIIFHKLKIKTYPVLEAASTKWNFLNFNPGLVGGHCISVDPYYLTYICKKNKIPTKIILAGRSINEKMNKYIARRVLSKLEKKNNKILILGFSFKENCPDIRNTKVADLAKMLLKKNSVEIYDPVINIDEAKKKYSFKFVNNLGKKRYDAILFLLAHNGFKHMQSKIEKNNLNKNGFLFDLKNQLKKSDRVEQL